MFSPPPQLQSPVPSFDMKGGRIELIVGPMFAGKSSELLRRLRRYSYAKRRCLAVKYGQDNRYSEDKVSTHDRQMSSCTTVGVSTLSSIEKMSCDFDVIGIDEGQFFPDLEEFCERAANNGVVVIVAALDADYKRESFGQVCNLIPKSESVVKLTAVCTECGNEATFTKRLSSETALEVIGGSDKYIPVCRPCFHSTLKVNKSPAPLSSCVNQLKETSSTNVNTPAATSRDVDHELFRSLSSNSPHRRSRNRKKGKQKASALARKKASSPRPTEAELLEETLQALHIKENNDSASPAHDDEIDLGQENCPNMKLVKKKRISLTTLKHFEALGNTVGFASGRGL